MLLFLNIRAKSKPWSQHYTYISLDVDNPSNFHFYQFFSKLSCLDTDDGVGLLIIIF